MTESQTPSEIWGQEASYLKMSKWQVTGDMQLMFTVEYLNVCVCVHLHAQKFYLKYCPSMGKERDSYYEKWFGIVIHLYIHLPYALEIVILDIYTMKMKCYIHTKTCMQVFTAALFIAT